MAARLGADVPFCLVGGRARVQGVGERVTPLDFEARDYLLVLPPFGVDTARVYAAWDDGQRADGPGEGEPNALTAAALAVEPRLRRWRDALGDVVGRAPTLAGSGSTWFVEGGPEGAGTPSWAQLRVGGEVARLVRVRTVPAGWDGS